MKLTGLVTTGVDTYTLCGEDNSGLVTIGVDACTLCGEYNSAYKTFFIIIIIKNSSKFSVSEKIVQMYI